MYVETVFDDPRLPDFDLEKIGKIIETRADGTYPEKILNLNRAKEVASSKPSIEFDHQIKYHTLDEISKELEEKQPPIAWVRLTDKGIIHGCTHAVVIKGLNKPNNTIYFNDPMLGENINDFLARWDEEDRVLVKVKIGKKEQRMIEDFVREKDLPMGDN